MPMIVKFSDTTHRYTAGCAIWPRIATAFMDLDLVYS